MQHNLCLLGAALLYVLLVLLAAGAWRCFTLLAAFVLAPPIYPLSRRVLQAMTM
jgi:hypothetical protein